MPSKHAKKFLEWFNGQYLVKCPEGFTNPMLGYHASTRTGRDAIAKSYLNRVQTKLDVPQGLDGIRQIIFSIETLISCFPEKERFSEPVTALRETLCRICSKPEEVGVYTGPYPTRFERILNED